MSTINVHALAASVVRESPSPDPDDMVVDFVSRIAPDDYAEALRTMARDLIRHAIRRQKAALNGGEPHTTGSRKVDAAREAWKRLLDAPEYVPSLARWIFLRDATRDQVLEMAGTRSQKSRELAAAAKQYKRLADTMEAQDAACVGDLADDTLEQLLAPAARGRAA